MVSLRAAAVFGRWAWLEPSMVALGATCGLGSFRHVPIHMTKGVPYYGTQNSSEVSPRTSCSRAVSLIHCCGAWHLAQ